jgi:hypothetical protein
VKSGETVFTEGSTASGVITFPEDNRIVFYQDFAAWLGVPAGIEFTVERITGDGKLYLSAPGYGAKDQYGNGQICIAMDSCETREVKEATVAEAVRRLSNPDLADALAKVSA